MNEKHKTRVDFKLLMPTILTPNNLSLTYIKFMTSDSNMTCFMLHIQPCICRTRALALRFSI